MPYNGILGIYLEGREADEDLKRELAKKNYLNIRDKKQRKRGR